MLSLRLSYLFFFLFIVYFRGKTNGIDVKETIPKTKMAEILRLSESRIENGAMNFPSWEKN
jgi:hypothetical protein